ncbi:hypothetical protein JOB18_020081 [Solea senegalensis]|uniref:Uncharacterized protein n=1 Tax=Solea senegalensis TaxID=28829 RepID=A0AAV6QET7_SOLSE|nr:hypothetical protein JOB18_020081 [Solea senegalensis]
MERKEHNPHWQVIQQKKKIKSTGARHLIESFPVIHNPYTEIIIVLVTRRVTGGGRETVVRGPQTRQTRTTLDTAVVTLLQPGTFCSDLTHPSE